MGWLEDLEGHTIALDTAPLISYIAREKPYVELLRPLFAAIAEGKVRAITSAVTLVEVLVRPLRDKHPELAAKYQDILLHSPNLTTMPLSADIAVQAAELRATLDLRTPDAIQVATARIGGAIAFLTNDKRLRVPAGLNRLVLDDLLAASADAASESQ